MTKLEKLYSIIENSRDVGVKLPKEVLLQVEELEEYVVDPVKDLIPVCPNCHAMLHRQMNGRQLTIQELQEKINRLFHNSSYLFNGLTILSCSS